MRNAKTFKSVILTTGLVALSACGSTSVTNQGNGATTGGVPAATGGAPSTGGSSQAQPAGGSNTGGVAVVGGSMATGGKAASGGAIATGGINATGGTIGVGGESAAAGSPGTGGSKSVGGGSNAIGGTTSQGGGSAVGGSKPTGGSASQGGDSSPGGSNGTGGKTSAGGTATAGAGNPTGGSTGTAGGSSGVTVQLDQTHQTIDGFGINDTWGSQFSTTQADQLFTTASGIGLSILRVGMNPSGSFYNSFESSNISAAKTRGAKIIGSTWSPPGNCKDNGKTTDGGHLLASCYNSWAATITSFAQNNGLYAMSIGNEGDFASCGSTEPCNGSYDTTLYTAKELVAFIKVVGPLLQKAGVKVIAPEASEWIHLWSNLSATGSVPGNKNSSDPLKCGCFGNSIATSTAALANCSSNCTSGNGYDYGHWLAKDATAWAALDIIGIHQYDTQVAEPWPSDVTAAKKPIWQTEMSGVKWWPETGPSTDIKNGVVVAGWIHNALTVGDANAWLWWWVKATGATNEGLYNSDGTDTKRHYTFGNFSKFVRPGYVRVDVTGNSDANLLLSAYKGTDGTVVVVAINKGTSAATVPIAIAGGTAPASCTPTVTSATDDLKTGTAGTVTGGTLNASLAATTVTTFVCK